MGKKIKKESDMSKTVPLTQDGEFIEYSPLDYDMVWPDNEYIGHDGRAVCVEGYPIGLEIRQCIDFGKMVIISKVVAYDGDIPISRVIKRIYPKGE